MKLNHKLIFLKILLLYYIKNSVATNEELQIKSILTKKSTEQFITMKHCNTNQKLWSNWAGNQKCCIKKIFYPKTKEELLENIKSAVNNNKKIRVVGSGHSWSNLICNKDYLISLKNLNNILSVDKEKNEVKVQAGITLKRLNEELDKLNLAIPNQAAVMNITLAGAVSTATHGTGHTGTFSSFIKEIELITADGETYILSEEQNPDIFKTALVSFGSLGIIYSYTIKCIPQFFLKLERNIMTTSELISNYKKLHNENNYFQFDWNPTTDEVAILKWNQVDETKEINGTKSFEALSSRFTGGKRLEEEIAIPFNELPNALKDLKKIYSKYRNKEYKIGDLLVRFVNMDNAYLSPASNSNVVYLSISTPVEKKYIKFYQEYENLLQKYKGKPHWGKLNFLDYKKASKIYGKGFVKFLEIRNKLDPHGIFLNNYVRKLIEKKT